MRRQKIGFVALAVGLAAGCATAKTYEAPGVDLSRYRTFTFRQPSPSASGQVAFQQSPAGQALRNEVASELREKGLVEVPPGEPADLEVAYHTHLQQKYYYTDWGYGPGWGWGWAGTTPAVTNYTEGTLIVDMLDPRTRTVVWRGTISDVVQNPENPNPERIAKAVDKVMDRYPEVAPPADKSGK